MNIEEFLSEKIEDFVDEILQMNTSEIWKKINQSILLMSIGFGNFFAWFILKMLFLEGRNR